LGIDSIEAEVEEEADWVGKIDPYLILSSNNAQLLKTNYLDDIGSHPVW
jgi:Ca2+-dependent lipid-binding protein